MNTTAEVEATEQATTDPRRSQQVAYAGLLRCAEPPVPDVLHHYVETVGAIDAWASIAARQAPAQVNAVVAARLGTASAAELHAQAREDLEVARQAGATLVCPEDADWPAHSLFPLGAAPPYTDARHAAPPLALYRRGRGWPLDTGRGIAIVGSRAATPYGVRVATELAADAAASGYTIVSGGAFGIDAAAHRGALLHAPDLHPTHIPTMAVLACGIDRSYPQAHRPLLDGVAAVGAVVSEYPPGTAPARFRFLVRNRLIAAFAEVTVVIEAGRRSGSLNTATTAGRMHRQVCAVPGPVTSAMSWGTNALIRSGEAVLIAGWQDLQEHVGPLTTEHSIHRVGDRPTDGLDLVSARVYEALPAAGPVSVDQLAVEAALPATDVISALGVLQAHAMAERRGSHWHRIVRPSTSA